MLPIQLEDRLINYLLEFPFVLKVETNSSYVVQMLDHPLTYDL